MTSGGIEGDKKDEVFFYRDTGFEMLHHEHLRGKCDDEVCDLLLKLCPNVTHVEIVSDHDVKVNGNVKVTRTCY